jgi:DNA-binding protein H-NS
MSIVIRTKTLKAFCGFLGVCLVFVGGYQLKDQFNPQTAKEHIYVAKADPEIIGTPELPALTELGATAPIETGLFTAENEPVTAEAKDRTLAEYQLNRALVRSQELQLLEEITKDTEASEGERQRARAEHLAKVRQIEMEVECEGALLAKDFRDVLVTIRNQQVTIMMTTTALEPEQLMQISDVVCRITGFSEEGIIVIPH